MISSSHGFIFIHVPRTGGNSIQSTLLEYADDDLIKKSEDLEQFGLRNDRFGVHKHCRLCDYHDLLGDRIYTDFFKFTSIRNPWDRLLSRWFRFKFGAVNSPVTKGRVFFRREVKPAWDKEQFIRFIEWHLNDKGADVWSAMPWVMLDGKVAIDGYIRYESVQADLDAICDKIGLPRRQLPHINRSRRTRPY